MLVGLQLGPFAVEREIGGGAMGTVYRARYTRNGQLVAIKLMAPGLGSSETALARFEREADILKQLNHPNIVRLYATGHYRGHPFYAMEYVEGESLDRVLQRRGRLPWEEVVTLGRQLCAGLQHAHEQGIVHRDIKPSNLMLLPDGTLKLTDFGIARDLDETRLTATHSTVGTSAYMSPEQCKGERTLSYKSDLYSMGVVFYEMLTGRKPFEADTPLEMFQLHVSGTFERPSRLMLDIPIWLDTLVCQLLEKAPERRPRDAAAVTEALNRIVDKVAAQQSAGVEAVKARAVDRARGAARPDEEDRQAARELRAAMGKKRGRRKGKPFYRRVGFQAAGLVVGLLVLGTLVYQAFRPASPEKLVQRAEKLMASGDPEDWARAREGPIREYLRRYRHREDEPARRMRAWADQVDVADREEKLGRLLRSRQGKSLIKVDPEPGVETGALEAVLAEESGDLAAARRSWQEAREKLDKESGQRPWYLLTEKHLRRLEEVEAREEHLRSKIDGKGEFAPDFRPESETERLAAEALRNELRKNLPAARDGWEKVKKMAQGKTGDQRLWYLLAARKVREPAEEK